LRKIEDFLQNRISKILDFGRKADEFLRLTTSDDSVNHVNAGPLGIQIKANIKADPFITSSELADILQVSTSSIARKIKELQSSGEITRRGADKNGWWDVLKQ